ncbi:MAG: NAD-dependent epimerase/dehydratase family protein [Chlamydiia bacterium]|nr:NAD-dependent epimerase/dehydratase family protein [Chlamydiia bacterium]
MSKCYAVTGANGHLGRHLVALLLQRGHRVRTLARQPLAGQDHRIVHVEDVDGLCCALDGVDGVFHTAAPTQMTASNPEIEIRRPIVDGTRNIINAAVQVGVPKIVYTSTAATVGLRQAIPLDESYFNTTSRHPQFRAKLEVEQQLAPMAESKGVRFLSVCPPSVLGPSLGRLTPSLKPYAQLVNGELPFLPPMRFHLLDVRDEAEAQLALMETDVVQHSRYILAGHYVDLRQVVQQIRQHFPILRLPRWTAPKAVFYLLAPFVPELNLTLVRECIGCDQRLDGSRVEREFALHWRPWQHTVLDTIEDLLLARTLR